MSKNRFFLRKEYSRDEKVGRIGAEEFTIDNSGVMNAIDGTRISPEAVSNNGKEWLLNNLRSELNRDEYEDFVDKMFRRHGKTGDRFNQQLVRYPPDLDTIELYEKLETYQDGPLTKPFDFILSQPLYMNEIEEEDGEIDVSFYTAVRFEEYDSTEEMPIGIHDESGEKVDEVDTDQSVKIPIRRRVELRIYTEKKLMSISNSEIPTRLQKEIYNIVLAVARESPEIEERQEEEA